MIDIDDLQDRKGIEAVPAFDENGKKVPKREMGRPTAFSFSSNFVGEKLWITPSHISLMGDSYLSEGHDIHVQLQPKE